MFFNYAPDFGQARQLRITGKLEEVHDPVLFEKAYAMRAGLEALLGKSIRPLLVMYRLSHGEAQFWTMMNALREEYIEILQF
jgi:hypothetical protein